MCDCVCGCLGVVLAVTVKVVEGRNMSNVYALNRSQKRCFMMFYYVLFHFICILLPLLCCTVYLSFLVWKSSDAKDIFSFYAFIINNNVLLYCIVKIVWTESCVGGFIQRNIIHRFISQKSNIVSLSILLKGWVIAEAVIR